jgi:hypothetical protein
MLHSVVGEFVIPGLRRITQCHIGQTIWTEFFEQVAGCLGGSRVVARSAGAHPAYERVRMQPRGAALNMRKMSRSTSLPSRWICVPFISRSPSGDLLQFLAAGHRVAGWSIAWYVELLLSEQCLIRLDNLAHRIRLGNGGDSSAPLQPLHLCGLEGLAGALFAGMVYAPLVLPSDHWTLADAPVRRRRYRSRLLDRQHRPYNPYRLLCHRGGTVGAH